ncbi:MAB_1171c family putative transporter [Actinoalloteichus caeruleus]|uniref:MAB_1171c family putative transporter n=1 Tax=Actinoalloteichus cyanogriseus TaxID=2893586 RepID=UPI0004A9FD94|nr:MAB_1171c family putative transporter [Actinoalloteichus caeruleus]
MRDAIQLLVIAVVLSGGVLKLLHLRRSESEHRAALRAMCLGLIALSVALVLELDAVTPALVEALGWEYSYALRHTPVLVAIFAWRVFFLCWVWEAGPTRDRRVRAHLWVLLGVLTARWLIAVLSPVGDAHAALTSDWSQAPWSAAGMLLYACYMGLTALGVTYLTIVWARDPGTRPWTRRGLRFITAGSIVALAYLVHKVVFMVAVLAGWQPGYDQYQLEWVLIATSALLHGIGTLMPLVASGVPAAIRLARHRAAYRRLGPLWLALTSARPGVVLCLAPAWVPERFRRLWDAVNLRHLDLRLYHRVVECWDVLVALHGHMDTRLRDRAYAEAVAAGEDAESAEAIAEAVMIRAALRRDEDDHRFVEEAARPGRRDRQETLADDIGWWQRVGRAWHHPVTRQLSGRLSPSPVPTG